MNNDKKLKTTVNRGNTHSGLNSCKNCNYLLAGEDTKGDGGLFFPSNFYRRCGHE